MFLVCFGFKFIVQVFRVKLLRKCKITSLLSYLGIESWCVSMGDGAGCGLQLYVGIDEG